MRALFSNIVHNTLQTKPMEPFGTLIINYQVRFMQFTQMKLL